MSDIIERVARAIHGTNTQFHDPTPADMARAAIAAMREPTARMIDNPFANGPLPMIDLDGSIQGQKHRDAVVEVYQSMIDAALA